MSSDKTSDSDIEWEECSDISAEIPCLFCPEKCCNIDSALGHSLQIHEFDLKKLKQIHSMDCYSFIKLINYIRKTNASSSFIMSSNEPLWQDDVHLKPLVENDPWLMFDFEEHFETEKSNENLEYISESNIIQRLQKALIQEGTVSEIPNKLQNLGSQMDSEFNNMMNIPELLKCSIQCISNLKIKDESNSEIIACLKNENESMREIMKNYIGENAINDENNREHDPDDSSYFDSYALFCVHYTMLSDKVRTEAYRNAIMRTDMNGKVVLDLGCGTGILSMFCAKSNAAKVYAVDKSDIMCYTIDIIRENGLEDVIIPVKRCIEEDGLPFDKVDIIVSEWMGYFLLFEGMLDSLIFARDNYLQNEGILLPNACSLYICGAFDVAGHIQSTNFWDDVYGFRMSCIAKEFSKEAVVEIVSADKIITTSSMLKSFDLYTCSISDTRFESTFSLTVTSEQSDAQLNCLVGYFDTHFNNSDFPISFSTTPLAAPTHWKQTSFYLPVPINVSKGQVIDGELRCTRSKNDSRSLDVIVKIESNEFSYYLSR